MRVYVILPAAGIGTRMAAGGTTPVAPKQFLTLDGTPVLVRSVRAFLAVERVSEVLVAVRAAEMDRVRELLVGFDLGGHCRVIEGGDNRQASVANGIAALSANADDVILVHDAVRPLIEPATIDRTIDAILKHGAAIVALPAIDTIKQVERTADGAIVTATIPRELIVQAQTPQGALFSEMQRAFAEAAQDEFSGTDEASVLERAGITVAVVPGSPRNMKITQPGDLELAEFYLGRGASTASPAANAAASPAGEAVAR
jgi:2-C-methyl-D-erythritol 4-phosphate cytidylyltransferase